MTNLQLAEKYFRWLASQVEVPRGKEYTEVLALMHLTEFVWLVPNDDNRLADGLDLRFEFVSINGEIGDAPCSVLEVMVALSRRMAFQVGGTTRGWAWQFMLNLGLEEYADPVRPSKLRKVQDMLESLVYRNYSPSGEGGFFPLQEPDEDQTKIEIWYQMAAYIEEILPD